MITVINIQIHSTHIFPIYVLSNIISILALREIIIPVSLIIKKSVNNTTSTVSQAQNVIRPYYIIPTSQKVICKYIHYYLISSLSNKTHYKYLWYSCRTGINQTRLVGQLLAGNRKNGFVHVYRQCHHTLKIGRDIIDCCTHYSCHIINFVCRILFHIRIFSVLYLT